MGKFEFYQDCKVKSWERDYFTVEANSYEEAEAVSYTHLKAAEILETVNKETALAADCRALADEVEMALKRYATYNLSLIHI